MIAGKNDPKKMFHQMFQIAATKLKKKKMTGFQPGFAVFFFQNRTGLQINKGFQPELALFPSPKQDLSSI